MPTQHAACGIAMHTLYGHVHPCVRPGQVLRRMEVLGAVARSRTTAPGALPVAQLATKRKYV